MAGTLSGRAAAARGALVDGAADAVWMHGAKPRVVFTFTITGGKVAAIEMIADPERIARLEVIPAETGQRGQVAGSSGIALARTTFA